MKQEKIQIQPSSNKLHVAIFWIVSISVATFLSVGFCYWTIVPYMQSSEYLTDLRTMMSTGDSSVLLNDQFVFDPDTNVEGILRNDFLREVSNQIQQDKSKEKSNPLLDKAIFEMDEYLQNHPSYYTYILSLADGYTLKSDLTGDPQYYAIAEKYYKKDLDVVRGRQDIAYVYAISLLQHNRKDDALKILRDLAVTNPSSAVVHYQLANVLMFLNDPTYYNEAYTNFEVALSYYWPSPDWITQNDASLKVAYQNFLKYFYKNNDFDNFYQVIVRLSVIDPAQKNIYDGVLGYMNQTHTIPKLNLGK